MANSQDLQRCQALLNAVRAIREKYPDQPEAVCGVASILQVPVKRNRPAMKDADAGPVGDGSGVLVHVARDDNSHAFAYLIAVHRGRERRFRMVITGDFYNDDEWKGNEAPTLKFSKLEPALARALQPRLQQDRAQYLEYLEKHGLMPKQHQEPPQQKRRRVTIDPQSSQDVDAQSAGSGGGTGDDDDDDDEQPQRGAKRRTSRRQREEAGDLPVARTKKPRSQARTRATPGSARAGPSAAAGARAQPEWVQDAVKLLYRVADEILGTQRMQRAMQHDHEEQMQEQLVQFQERLLAVEGTQAAQAAQLELMQEKVDRLETDKKQRWGEGADRSGRGARAGGGRSQGAAAATERDNTGQNAGAGGEGALDVEGAGEQSVPEVGADDEHLEGEGTGEQSVEDLSAGERGMDEAPAGEHAGEGASEQDVEMEQACEGEGEGDVEEAGDHGASDVQPAGEDAGQGPGEHDAELEHAGEGEGEEEAGDEGVLGAEVGQKHAGQGQGEHGAEEAGEEGAPNAEAGHEHAGQGQGEQGVAGGSKHVGAGVEGALDEQEGAENVGEDEGEQDVRGAGEHGVGGKVEAVAPVRAALHGAGEQGRDEEATGAESGGAGALKKFRGSNEAPAAGDQGVASGKALESAEGGEVQGSGIGNACETGVAGSKASGGIEEEQPRSRTWRSMFK